MNMSINYNIEKMRISDFNPYSKFYVAHAFVEGMLFYTSTNTIHNGKLKSTNVMSIKKIEVSRKLKGIGLYEMPLRLAITILTDRKGNIDLDITAEGTHKPDNIGVFHYEQIVFDGLFCQSGGIGKLGDVKDLPAL